MISVAEPILRDDEQRAVAEVLQSGWITMGEQVSLFETEFAALHKQETSVALGSCTAALHLIVEGLGLGPGDEVLVPSMTFVATANSVLYARAKPVFVDIEDVGRPLISLADAERKCTSRTRAVIVMHFAGYPVDMSAWRRFTSARGLFLVEDAAHAAGLSDVGSASDAAAFSFYGNKNMTTAEGGAVISTDAELLGRIRKMRSHGLTSGTFERHHRALPLYDVTMLGYNYRMDEIRAAIGRVQARKLLQWNATRGELTRLYRERLSDQAPDIEVPFDGAHESAYHILPILLPTWADREEIVQRLRRCGVQTTMHYPPAHTLTLYRDLCPGVHLPVTEEFARRELTLPLHPRMTEDEVDHIVWSLARCLSALQDAVHATP